MNLLDEIINNFSNNNLSESKNKARAKKYRGERGPHGERGIQGEKGAQGERGLRGKQGEKGERGENGERGEKGDRGEKGERGEKGQDSISKVFCIIENSEAVLISNPMKTISENSVISFIHSYNINNVLSLDESKTKISLPIGNYIIGFNYIHSHAYKDIDDIMFKDISIYNGANKLHTFKLTTRDRGHADTLINIKDMDSMLHVACDTNTFSENKAIQIIVTIKRAPLLREDIL
jgi:hypothetical protein